MQSMAFIMLKHVGDIYWNKFKKKVHLVGSYYANTQFSISVVREYMTVC